MVSSGDPNKKNRSGFVSREIAIGSFPVAVYLLLSYPNFITSTFFISHDTLMSYEYFSYALQQYWQTNQFPPWAPYAAYGETTYIHELALVPTFFYAAIALGRLVGIADSWLLFRALLLLEVWLYAVGAYFLCREFVARSAAFLATATLVWTVIVSWNYPYILHLVVLMPLGLLCLVKWSRNSDWNFLVCAIISAALSCWGAPAYCVPLQAFVYVLSTIVLFCIYRPKILPLPRLTTWILAGFAVLLSAAVVYPLLTATENVTVVLTGRNPVTMQVDLDAFLTYGGGGIRKTIEYLIGVPTDLGPNAMDALFFSTGIAPIFVIYTVSRARSREAYAFIILALVFFLFCWGRYSPVAYAAYYFPGMSYFRHVGLMYAMPKLFAGVLTALGIQALLNHLHGTRSEAAAARAQVARLTVFVAMLAGACAFWYLVVYKGWVLQSQEVATVAFVGTVLASYVIFYFAVRRVRREWIIYSVGLIVFANGAAYHILSALVLPAPVQSSDNLHDRSVERAFEETRTVDVSDHPRGAIFNALTQRGASYVVLNSFLRVDACVSPFRVDYVMQGVVDLVRHQFGGEIATDDLFNVLRNGLHSNPDHPIFAAMGCNVSKLQLVSESVSTTFEEGANWPRNCVGSSLCLEDPVSRQRQIMLWPTGRPPMAKTLAEQGMQLRQFSSGAITLTVSTSEPAWLIYADAYHPSWRVRVDGQDQRLWKANLAFKAVRVSPGQHLVEFYFHDELRRSIFFWSVVLQTTALLVLLGITFAGMRTPRPEPLAT